MNEIRKDKISPSKKGTHVKLRVLHEAFLNSFGQYEDELQAQHKLQFIYQVHQHGRADEMIIICMLPYFLTFIQ